MVQREVLPNGVRIVTETVPGVESVSVGYWFDSGACDESDKTRGISHFIEHMLFKGTTSRSARDIAREFDYIGGQVNAFTEKECTCYYAKVLAEHLPAAMDVLTDMLRFSRIDTKDIELEKNVILEEIKMHEDTPEDFVHDLFAEKIWNRHPLGYPIMGSADIVQSLKREDLTDFIEKHYTPDRLVVAAAGNLNHKEFVERIADSFGSLKGTGCPRAYAEPEFNSESFFAKRSMEQVQFCIGARGFSNQDGNRYPLAIIDSALGGGMSSRLFQEIRENRGLAYNIGSYSTSYSTGGFFTVYGGTSPDKFEEVLSLVKQEFASLPRGSLTEEEMARAKNQIKGSLVLSQEGMGSRMIRIGRSELFYGRVVTLEELISSILAVTADDVARVSGIIFDKEFYPTIAVGPERL
jgi:predicted Zn-dependent peptidase